MKNIRFQSLVNPWTFLFVLCLSTLWSWADEDLLRIEIARPDGSVDENALTSPQVTPEYALIMNYLMSPPTETITSETFPVATYSKLSFEQKAVVQRHLLSRIKETQIPSLMKYASEEDGKNAFSKYQMAALAHRMMFLILPLNQGEDVRICMNSGSAMPEAVQKDLMLLEKISEDILKTLRAITQPTSSSNATDLSYQIQRVVKSQQPIPASCVQFKKVELTNALVKKTGQKPQKKKPVTPERKSSK